MIKIFSKYFLFFSGVFLLLFSCKTSEKSISASQQNVENLINNNPVFKNSFTGFILYDLKNKKEKFNINGNKFFTPASITKIFTYYTALNVLKDSVPVIKYSIIGDSLFFSGSGNPTTLNAVLNNDTTLTHFLSKRKEKLFYCDNNFTDQKYGDGWAWNDYLYSYHLEKSSLPLFGNKIVAEFLDDSIFMYPEFFRDKFTFVEDSMRFDRAEYENKFELGLFQSGKLLPIPFKTDCTTTISLLSHLTGKPINQAIFPVVGSEQSIVLKQKINDSIYIRLLHNSDNFIAEQLMLMCSSELFDTLDVKRSIHFSKNNLMPYLLDSCRWVDGSGLSRYNLFKPKSIIKVLEQILNKTGIESVKKMFPVISVDANSDSAKSHGVFAKSGTLSNNYNLSGYIITKKSNVYLFSFMNNHFLTGNRQIKTEMHKILSLIIEKY